ncbi:fungal fruit body lectin [Peziza echinospora]|nr:fungal fruit body lectin [Peziza echinospora]
MSYSITVRLYQTNTNAYFSLVEKTVWHYANGGTWATSNDEYTLTMGGSGTSGVLRLQSDTGERVTFALGVHNYKRWCDIVTGLSTSQTGVIINGEYYDAAHKDRCQARERQLDTYSVTSTAGRKFTVTYTVKEGNALKANIIIG